MKIYELNANCQKRYVKMIVQLHSKMFSDFFLTQLGTKFLQILYKGYLEDEKSGIIVAENEKKEILGFIAYSNDYAQFYKNLLKKHLVEFAGCSLIAAIKHPSFIKRILRAFGKSDEVKREYSYVELASIAVDSQFKGAGIGSALIDYLKKMTNFSEYAYISLETDADNNEHVNNFYKKNDFKLFRCYCTPEGRRMNEYHYYANKNKGID